jgi:cyanophycin synthetase
MRLDLEKWNNFQTNKIDGFKERIEAMLPTLIEHRCSEGGGFFPEWNAGLDGVY